jgi:hypothetical protein
VWTRSRPAAVRRLFNALNYAGRGGALYGLGGRTDGGEPASRTWADPMGVSPHLAKVVPNSGVHDGPPGSTSPGPITPPAIPATAPDRAARPPPGDTMFTVSRVRTANTIAPHVAPRSPDDRDPTGTKVLSRCTFLVGEAGFEPATSCSQIWMEAVRLVPARAGQCRLAGTTRNGRDETYVATRPGARRIDTSLIHRPTVATFSSAASRRFSIQ